MVLSAVLILIGILGLFVFFSPDWSFLAALVRYKRYRIWNLPMIVS